MSLLIVGSTSKVAQNVVLQLARAKQYERVTITDLLPLYDFHRRYYKLRALLKREGLPLRVDLTKITRTEQLATAVSSHDHVLSLTHDYFESVTSKTRLALLTAQLAPKQKRIVFASPLEYDHHGFANPQAHRQANQEEIQKILPSASFIRSDLQDSSELFAYLRKSKNILEEWRLQIPLSFRPKVVDGAYFASEVARLLASGAQGSNLSVVGETERDYKEVAYDKHLQNWEIDHHQGNIRSLVANYRGLAENHSELLLSRGV